MLYSCYNVSKLSLPGFHSDHLFCVLPSEVEACRFSLCDDHTVIGAVSLWLVRTLSDRAIRVRALAGDINFAFC